MHHNWNKTLILWLNDIFMHTRWVVHIVCLDRQPVFGSPGLTHKMLQSIITSIWNHSQPPLDFPGILFWLKLKSCRCACFLKHLSITVIERGKEPTHSSLCGQTWNLRLSVEWWKPLPYTTLPPIVLENTDSTSSCPITMGTEIAKTLQGSSSA